MGKYMRKAKISGEVAVMEVSHQSTIGVRTRAARALAALQKPATDSSLAYLELRSRRLEKPLPPTPTATKQAKDAAGPSPKKSGGGARANAELAGSVSLRRRSDDDEAAPDVEVSFGENVLEGEMRERFSRDTTPCSLIRNPEITVTPGSTTRSTKSISGARRMQSVVHQNIPSALEMEEFFSGAEQLQQRIFIEKYNFDPLFQKRMDHIKEKGKAQRFFSSDECIGPILGGGTRRTTCACHFMRVGVLHCHD